MSRFVGENDAAVENERVQLLQVQEERWRTEELRLNAEYESEPHKNAGRDAGSDRALLMNDTVDETLITFIVKRGGKCKSFVRVRSMLSKHKTPTGKNQVSSICICCSTSTLHNINRKEFL